MGGVTGTVRASCCLCFYSQAGQGVPGHPPWFYLLPSHSEVWESLPGGAFLPGEQVISGGRESPRAVPLRDVADCVSVLQGGQPVISRFTGLTEIAANRATTVITEAAPLILGYKC